MLLGSSKGRTGKHKARMIQASLTVLVADIANQSQNPILSSMAQFWLLAKAR